MAEVLFIGSACACNILQFIISIILLVMMSAVTEKTTVDISSVTQITADWSVKPWTDVNVRPQSQGWGGCPVGEENLWTRTWGGTIEGCDINKSNTDITKTIITKSSYNSRRSGSNKRTAERNLECYGVAAQQPITMTGLDGNFVCGTRGGSTFATAVRPDVKTKLCPTGFTPCSSETSAENTVCTKYDVTGRYDCPITFMAWVTASQYNAQTAYQNTAFYKSTTFGSGYLVTSKVKGNSLPVLKPALEPSQPCMTPGQSPRISNAVYYPMEYDKDDECELDVNTNKKTDSRFAISGYSINQYNLEQANGVTYILSGLRKYNLIQSQAENRKKQVQLAAYVRPTISWKLECESSFPVSETVSYIQNADVELSRAETYSSDVSLWAIALLVTAVFVTPIMLCTCVRMARGVGPKVIVLMINQGLILGCAIMIFSNQESNATSIEAKLAKLNKLALVNNCGDEYTKVPMDKYIKDFDSAVGTNSAASVVALISIILVCCWVLGACVIAGLKGLK